MNIFNIETLQPFDIVLIRFEGDETSEQIRTSCNSEYSHTFIYLGNGSFIEGNTPVVSLFSFNRYYFENLNDIKVLRLNDEKKKIFNQTDAEKCLRGLSYCNYSKRLLYFIEKRNINQNTIDKFFKDKIWEGGIVCSTLITLSYFAGGIDISGNKEPFYAHFGDIEKYDGFEDVTNSVFNEVTIDDTKRIFDYFTTSQTGSILEKQSIAIKELNTYVENKYRDIKANPNNYNDIAIINENLGFSNWEDIYPNIMRWFLTETGQKIDNELSQKIISTGYNSLWFEEIHNNPFQFFPMYYYNYNDETLPSNKDLEFIRNSLEKTLENLEYNEKQVFNNFIMCPSKTFHILLDMYRSFSDLIRTSITQYNYLIK